MNNPILTTAELEERYCQLRLDMEQSILNLTQKLLKDNGAVAIAFMPSLASCDENDHILQISIGPDPYKPGELSAILEITNEKKELIQWTFDECEYGDLHIILCALEHLQADERQKDGTPVAYYVHT